MQNAFAYGLWVAGLALHHACARIGCFVIPVGAGTTSRQADYLVSPGSTVLLEVGILVLTTLTREASPMIRYWTNDYARLDLEPGRCGRSHARFPGGILGRADDLIIYRVAKFYPVQVEGVVRSFAELTDESGSN